MIFELSDYEKDKATEWNKSHVAKHHKGKEPYVGAAGGRCSYIVTYTGLGVMLAIECSVCRYAGESSDVYHESLTDFSDF